MSLDLDLEVPLHRSLTQPILIAGLPRIVLGGSGAHLPERFTVYPTFIAHALLAELLVVLAAIHIAAALFHQFVLRDGLLSRMAYGHLPQHTDHADCRD